MDGSVGCARGNTGNEKRFPGSEVTVIIVFN